MQFCIGKSSKEDYMERSVILIEKDESIQFVIETILLRLKYPVIHSNINSLPEVLCTTAHSVIIVDEWTIAPNDLSVYKEIYQRIKGKFQVILITTNSKVNPSLAAHCDDILFKPFDIDAFDNIVVTYMDRFFAAAESIDGTNHSYGKEQH